MIDDSKILSIFPTLIYCDHIDLEYEDLYNILFKINKENPKPKTEWQCNTYNTLGIYDAFTSIDIPVKKTIDKAQKHVIEFAKNYTKSKNFKIECKDFWFNISKPGNYQEYHNHSWSHFSAIIYLDVPENSGNLIFKSHAGFMDNYSLPKTDDDISFTTADRCSYKPTEKTIVIFRSHLQHKVEENLSNKNRISISMNFIMKL